MTSKEGGDIKTTIRKAKNTVRKVKRVAKTVGAVAENPAELFKLRKRVAGVLPPEARQTLEAVGNDKITDIKIVRTPVEKAITGLLNLISLGTYSKAVKQSDYDSMFHLALFINNAIQLDKQAVIKFYRANPIKDTSEVYNLPVSGDITFNELISKTRDYMGADKFSNYDSRRNNCQDFIMGILNANGLSSPEAEAFVKQDANAVFSKMPQFTDKIAKVFTDIGAVADRVIEGEGRKRRIKRGGAISEADFEEIYTFLEEIESKFGHLTEAEREIFERASVLAERYDDTEFADIPQADKNEMETLHQQLRPIFDRLADLPEYRRPRPTRNKSRKKRGGEMCACCRNMKNGYGYTAYQNGECWTVLNQFTGRVIAYCTTEEKARKQISLLNRMEESEEAMKRADLEKMAIPHAENVMKDIEGNKNIRKKLLEKKPTINKSKTMQTWRQFWAESCKGKKFPNRQAVNDYMKEMAKKYKEMKSK